MCDTSEATVVLLYFFSVFEVNHIYFLQTFPGSSRPTLQHRPAYLSSSIPATILQYLPVTKPLTSSLQAHLNCAPSPPNNTFSFTSAWPPIMRPFMKNTFSPSSTVPRSVFVEAAGKSKE